MTSKWKMHHLHPWSLQNRCNHLVGLNFVKRKRKQEFDTEVHWMNACMLCLYLWNDGASCAECALISWVLANCPYVVYIKKWMLELSKKNFPITGQFEISFLSHKPSLIPVGFYIPSLRSTHQHLSLGF